jgi:hypothetical protein
MPVRSSLVSCIRILNGMICLPADKLGLVYSDHNWLGLFPAEKLAWCVRPLNGLLWCVRPLSSFISIILSYWVNSLVWCVNLSTGLALHSSIGQFDLMN